MNVKIGQLGTDAPDINDLHHFLGFKDNGDGTFTDYKFSYEQIASLGKKRITVVDEGDTLIDPFFSLYTISEIITQGQTYLSDVDFTQSGNTITGGTISFFEGQVLIAKI